MPVIYESACIYCGNTFKSSKRNAKYDKDSCRVMYFKEKKTYEAAFTSIAYREARKHASEYMTALINEINIDKKLIDDRTLIKVAKIFADAANDMNRTKVKEVLFANYLKEKLKKL